MMSILLFKNIRNVILAEKLLLKDDIMVTVRPVPSQLSSECGMCLEVNIKDVGRINSLLSEREINYNLVEL